MSLQSHFGRRARATRPQRPHLCLEGPEVSRVTRYTGPSSCAWLGWAWVSNGFALNSALHGLLHSVRAETFGQLDLSGADAC